MSKKIYELQQERATITNRIRSIMDEFENKQMDGMKKEEMAKLEVEFDSLNNKITTEQKQIERERITGEKIAKMAENKKDVNSEVMNAFKDYIITGSKHSFDAFNALQQSNPTQAGYLVAPEQFQAEIIKGVDNAFLMRKLGKVLPALKGAHSLGYPTRTARTVNFSWGTELSTPTTDTTLAFGKREFKPNPGTLEILVSKTLLRNAPNAEAFVMAELQYGVGESLENAYMTGNGVGQPLGIFTASADGISTARDISTGNTTTEIKFDGLMEAKYSLKAGYNAQWLFHRDAIKQIAKLKDADGQYIWQPAVTMGASDMLLGRPVNSSEYAPNTFTTGQYVGMYGDFSYYWIVDALTMEMQVLNELYARTNQVDYMLRIETDACPVLAEAFARIKLA